MGCILWSIFNVVTWMTKINLLCASMCLEQTPFCINKSLDGSSSSFLCLEFFLVILQSHLSSLCVIGVPSGIIRHPMQFKVHLNILASTLSCYVSTSSHIPTRFYYHQYDLENSFSSMCFTMQRYNIITLEFPYLGANIFIFTITICYDDMCALVKV